jgi:hypothetical protein
MFQATFRVLSHLGARSHVTLQRKPILGVTHELRAAQLKHGYTSSVWASNDVVQNCRLARPGQRPTRVSPAGRSVELFNLDQLIGFARTATGKWFPAIYHRALMQRQDDVNGVLRLKSNVWLTDRLAAAGRLQALPDEAPAAVEIDGRHDNLFNSAQLVPTAGGHTFHNGAVMRNADDQVVLQYVAAREGFTSKIWVAAYMVGLLDGVTPLAHVCSAWYGTVAMYNMDQLVWPIPVPAEPHSWAVSGGAMRPHEQLFLEKARAEHGFVSRQWAASTTQLKLNNVVPGAATVLLHMPGKSIEVLNRDQLLGSAAPLC